MGVREHTAEGIHYHEQTWDAPEGAELPLIVAFHGRGGAPHVPLGRYYGVTAPVRLVVPRGPLELGGGYAWFEANATASPERLARDLAAGAARVAAFYQRILERHPTRHARIASGFSQGGAVVFALAILYPHLLTDAFPTAGLFPEALVPGGPPARCTPIRAMHGTADPTVPLAPTAQLIERLRALGYDVELRTFEGVGHEMSPQMDAQLHAWLEAALG